MTDVMIGSSQLTELSTASNYVILTSYSAALLGHLGASRLLASGVPDVVTRQDLPVARFPPSRS